MSTVGSYGAESGAGPLLQERYRLEEEPPPGRARPVLVEGFDEVSERTVTLLVLPDSSSMLERLALRSQVRRMSEIEHPGLPTVLDVVDTEAGFAVVLPASPEARLLADGGFLPADGPAQLRSALQALHAVGRTHGALDEHAVLVLPDATVRLLPVPPDPAVRPAEDLRALAALAARHGHGAEPDVPAQRVARPPRPPVTPPATAASAVRPPTGGATRFRSTSTSSYPRSWQSGAPRAGLVAAGALVGALLADLVSRLVT